MVEQTRNMKVKLFLLLVVMLLSGCVSPNSRVQLPYASRAEDSNSAKALWQSNPGRCIEKSTEIMTLEDVLKIAHTWDSFIDLRKQVGFVPPRVVSVANTRYPDLMLSQGIDGKVFLLVQIDRKGKVADVHAVCASRPEFISNAMEALKKYRYEPAMVNGVAVNSTAFQPIKFTAPGH